MIITTVIVMVTEVSLEGMGAYGRVPIGIINAKRSGGWKDFCLFVCVHNYDWN